MSLDATEGNGYRPATDNPVETYLARDSGVQTLHPKVRTIVSSSVLQVIDAPISRLTAMAEELDGKRDSNPYLLREEPLADSYRGINDYFARHGSWMTPSQKSSAIRRIFQITLVERMIGARIAENSGWPRRRLSATAVGAKKAMDFGKRAVRQFAR